MAFDLSTQSGRADARAAGNFVGTDDSGNVYSEPGHPGGQANAGVGAGGGGGGGGGPSAGDLSKISAGFAASAGMTQKQLDEQIREFDATLEFQKQQWREKGLPELAIEQRAQDLEEQKFAELTAEATRQQGWVEEIGKRQAALAEKTQLDANTLAVKSQADQNAIAQGQLGVAQGQLGLDTIKSAAGFSGPADWIKAANFTRGVSQSNLPGFITQLLSGKSTATVNGVAPGTTMSDPNSMAGYASALGAGGGVPAAGATSAAGGQAGASNVDAASQQLRDFFAQGGNALAPQQLEGLSPTEMSMLTGGGESVGADVNGFLDTYKKSRIGQTASLPGLL